MQPHRLVGRARELEQLEAFARGTPQALVITGAAGIGKTALWQEGAAAARAHGLRVLTARPARAERELSLAGVSDVLDGVPLDHGPLAVAVLRVPPAGAPPDPRAIALGLLAALRELAPALIAIDDVQWLDAASAEALAFVARRCELRFLLARRSSRAAPLEQAFDRAALRRLAVGPLDEAGTRRLLAERLGGALPRRVQRDVIVASGGNPLFALELGRALLERGVPEIGEPLVLPAAAGEALGARLRRLPPAIRRLVLAVALSPGLRTGELIAIGDRRALDAALASGVLADDGPGARVRVAHPLLGAAAMRTARVSERRRLHRELAAAVRDRERAARHLALATTRPDAALADTIAAASERAAARGAAEDAAELARHALRLTPADSSARAERVLALAEALDTAGEDRQVTELLVPALEWLPAGEPRVRAHLLLGDGGAVTHADEHEQHLERALAECGPDRVLRAPVLARRAIHVAVVRVERVAQAEGWALEAVAAAPPTRHALAWTRALRGRPLDAGSAGERPELYASLERIAAIRRIWRGEVEAARVALARLLAEADERGEAWSYFVLRVHRCELELRAGDWATAATLLDEWEQSGDGAPTATALGDRCRALEAIGRGDADAARSRATATIAAAEATGMRWDALEARRALGVAALLEGRADDAAEQLWAVWEHVERAGIEDPGAFPVAPDLVEALMTVGRAEQAAAVTARLDRLAYDQRHPWGRASALRCRGLLDPRAAEAFSDAARAYARAGLRFDAARSLLLLGLANRRHRQWAAARAALTEAVQRFDALGSTGWAARARAERERVGGGVPGRRRNGELTPTERRAAELAAAGHSNREIAQALFIATHTVEVQLSRVYAKLGVRSRAQLAARLNA